MSDSKRNDQVSGAESELGSGLAAEHLAEQLKGRRRVLEILGTALVAVPALGLTACGGDSTPAPTATAPAAPSAPMGDMKEAAESAMGAASDAAADAETAAEDMADEAMDEAADAVDAMEDAAEEMASDTIATDATARVDENGAQAAALGYRHDATTVDAAVQTRYAAGQMCSNCVLYQGGDAEWGGCPLFVGAQVKSTGWCSAYAAAS